MYGTWESLASLKGFLLALFKCCYFQCKLTVNFIEPKELVFFGYCLELENILNFAETIGNIYIPMLQCIWFDD